MFRWISFYSILNHINEVTFSLSYPAEKWSSQRTWCPCPLWCPPLASPCPPWPPCPPCCPALVFLCLSVKDSRCRCRGTWANTTIRVSKDFRHNGEEEDGEEEDGVAFLLSLLWVTWKNSLLFRSNFQSTHSISATWEWQNFENKSHQKKRGSSHQKSNDENYEPVEEETKPGDMDLCQHMIETLPCQRHNTPRLLTPYFVFGATSIQDGVNQKQYKAQQLCTYFSGRR